MKFFFHENAETELIKAVEYYNDCRYGLGIEFSNEVYAPVTQTIS